MNSAVMMTLRAPAYNGGIRTTLLVKGQILLTRWA